MDVSMDPGAALMLRMGPSQQAASLSAIKREATTEAAVATMAMQSAGAAPVDPNRGQLLDTRA